MTTAAADGAAFPAEPASSLDATDAPDPALIWQVTTEGNPFDRKLVFLEHGDEFLWWKLDPLALNALLAALSQVRDEQLAALGITATPTDTRPQPSPKTTELPDNEDTLHPDTEQRPALSREWWGNHKLLAALLLITVVLFIIGLVNGQG